MHSTLILQIFIAILHLMCIKTCILNGCAFFAFFCTVQLLFPWLPQEGGQTPRMFKSYER